MRSRISTRPSHCGFLLMSLLLSFAFVTPALSVSNIHDVFWPVGNGLVTSSGSSKMVIFDAYITSSDATELRFSIVEMSSQQTLLDFAYPMQGQGIVVGSPVTISLSLQLRCTQTGTLEASARTLYVRFCDLTSGASHVYDSGLNGPWVGDVGMDSFVLGIADETGAVHATTGSLQCGTSNESTMSSMEMFTKQNQQRLDRLAENGDSGSIGIYFDQEGTVCSGEILPGIPTNVYVIAKLNGVTACGIQGGEFRFAGVPESWQVYPVPIEDMLGIGNPFTNGVSFGLPTCHQPANNAVVLYSVLIIATALETDVTFSIESRLDPSNPNYACALASTCDAPYFGQVCMDGISCYVNPTSPKACETLVAVKEETWGSVKKMFQE